MNSENSKNGQSSPSADRPWSPSLSSSSTRAARAVVAYMLGYVRTYVRTYVRMLLLVVCGMGDCHVFRWVDFPTYGREWTKDWAGFAVCTRTGKRIGCSVCRGAMLVCRKRIAVGSHWAESPNTKIRLGRYELGHLNCERQEDIELFSSDEVSD